MAERFFGSGSSSELMACMALFETASSASGHSILHSRMLSKTASIMIQEIKTGFQMDFEFTLNRFVCVRHPPFEDCLDGPCQVIMLV